MTRAELLARHSSLATELLDAHRAMGNLLAQERHIKVQVFNQTGGESDKRRDNAAAIASLPITEEVFRLRGEIDALTEERDDIRLQLAYTQ